MLPHEGEPAYVQRSSGDVHGARSAGCCAGHPAAGAVPPSAPATTGGRRSAARPSFGAGLLDGASAPSTGRAATDAVPAVPPRLLLAQAPHRTTTTVHLARRLRMLDHRHILGPMCTVFYDQQRTLEAA
jgi:hypothetical protein